MYTRPTKGVLGFTRETVIALTTNIESCEYVCRNHHHPEHPRASTTDDVECLFIIMRDLAGKHFTVRTWKYNGEKYAQSYQNDWIPIWAIFITPVLMIGFMRVRHHRLMKKENQNETHEIGE